MAPEAQALANIIAKIIHTRRDQIRISPNWVATEAMMTLDPRRQSVPLVYLGCHLELRQLARSALRLHFEEASPTEDEFAQSELFPDLQWRYPVERKKTDTEPEYVLLEVMTDKDIRFNVRRLRKEANAKLKHADALEAFGRNKRRSA